VLRLDGARRVSAARLALISLTALDRPLLHDAELTLGEPSDEALVLGALQRARELGDADDRAQTLLLRGSCGAEVLVGPGSLWMQLALTRPDALVRCEPSRLLNRYVRPLLRALTKVGALAHYFDRDWISTGKRPVAMVALAHDAATGRALVEAIVAVRTPFAIRARPSYLGKAPATLADVGAAVEISRLGDAIAEAYGSAYGRSIVEMPLEMPEMTAEQPQGSGDDLRAEPRWAATRDEAIGVVGAGRDVAGRMRVGGELMASRDAVARLEERLAAAGGADPAEIGALVQASLGAPDVALVGVRSLTSLRDVIVEASFLSTRAQ
jgi:hypothetical protein